MIVDNALRHRDPRLGRRQQERLLAIRRRAQVFVFTAEASRLVGRFANQCGDLVLRHRQFALAPFPETYVECDCRAFMADFPGMTNAETEVGFTRENMDHRVGYLISGDTVSVFVCGPDDSDGQIGAFYYTLAPPGQRARTDTAVIPMSAGGEWHKLAFGLGRAAHHIHDEDERQSLLGEFEAHSYFGGQWMTRSLSTMMLGSAGEIRNVWACRLWLNRPGHVTYTEHPAGRRFLRGREIAYTAYRIVDIDLGRMRSVRRAFALSGPRLSPRRHNVRGAFHHHGGNVACEHQWPLIPDVDGRWQCRSCGRLRWWVKDHTRGDATRGWVSHEYAVHV
jgi:hypothetical protein